MCDHKKWIAKFVPLSDKRPSLREFCANCGLPNGGKSLGCALPMEADENTYVASHKYLGKSLGQIAKIDRDYLKWLIVHSKARGRAKKAAARIYYGEPYIPPKQGEIYLRERVYNPMRGIELIKKLEYETKSS